MDFFFVFQNKTYKKEYEGNYLWAPKYDKNGNTKSHWNSMQKVKAGDIIFSCVNKEIRAIAVAKKGCIEAPNPFDGDNQLWEKDGYKIEVEYFHLKKPLNFDSYRMDLLPLMPSYNAPLNKKGKSNTGYLFEINKEVSDYFMDKIRENLTEEEFDELYANIFGNKK